MPLFCAFTSLTIFFPDLARQIKQTNDAQDSFFFFFKTFEMMSGKSTTWEFSKEPWLIFMCLETLLLFLLLISSLILLW